MSYDTFLAALHPEDRAEVDETVHRVLADRSEYDIEYRTVWSDGSTHWIAAKGRGYYDAAGQPLRMEGVALDITERKRAEVLLHRQAHLLEIAFDAVLVWDLEGRLSFGIRAPQRSTALPRTRPSAASVMSCSRPR